MRQQQQTIQQYQQVPDLVVLSCAICASPTVQLCKGCRSVAYCNREHQIKDRSRHSPNCHPRSERAIGADSFSDPSRQARKPIDHLTPGKTFDVDAILIPVNQSLPSLVKASFEVVADETEMRIKHEERCFDKLLGAAVPWIDDAQWDEEMSEGSPYSLSPSNMSLPNGTFSLHCRPNGVTNKCYETLAGKQKLSSRTDTPVWGAIDPKDKHLHGNGSFLVLKHPSRTNNAHLSGAPVIDATLHDVKHVAYYLKQRQYYMGRAGGAQMGPIPMAPPPAIPYAIPQPLPPFSPIFVPPQHISRTRSSSPIRGRPVTRISPERSSGSRSPSPQRIQTSSRSRSPSPQRVTVQTTRVPGIPFSPPRTTSDTKTSRVKRFFGS